MLSNCYLVQCCNVLHEVDINCGHGVKFCYIFLSSSGSSLAIYYTDRSSYLLPLQYLLVYFLLFVWHAQISSMYDVYVGCFLHLIIIFRTEHEWRDNFNHVYVHIFYSILGAYLFATGTNLFRLQYVVVLINILHVSWSWLMS